MSGGDQQSVQIRRADNRQMIGRIGPQPGPRFFNLRVGQGRSQLQCAGQNFLHRTGGDSFFEADILDRGARDDSSVIPGHEVNVLGPQHPIYVQYF